MDQGATSHCSLHLAGLPPSTSPPPSWKGARQYRRIDTHCDSHIDLTMSHTFDISEDPPTPSFGMGKVPLSVYGTP